MKRLATVMLAALMLGQASGCIYYCFEHDAWHGIYPPIVWGDEDEGEAE